MNNQPITLKTIALGIIGIFFILVIVIVVIALVTTPPLTPEEERIEQMKELPDSCYGVNSIDTELYPTGEECLKAIGHRIYEYCLSEETKLAEKGAEARAQICQVSIVRKLIDQCKDSDDQGVFSVSPDVCAMENLIYAYQNLIPK